MNLMSVLTDALYKTYKQDYFSSPQQVSDQCLGFMEIEDGVGIWFGDG